MDYQLSFLKEQDYPLLFQTFQDAFADYIVDMSGMDEDKLYNRWIKNHVQYRASVGVWDLQQLVGFTMISTDVWQGAPTAFNSATGIIERYRGLGLTQKMVEFVKPKLQKVGIQKLFLEVIQGNTKAIKAYKKAGFEIVRNFDCYKLEPENYHAPDSINDNLEIKEVDVNDIKLCRTWFEWQPSWENSTSAVLRIPDKKIILGGFLEGDLVGYIVYYPAFGQIMQLLVAPFQRKEKVATTLLDHVVQKVLEPTEGVRVLNIDTSDTHTIELLTKAGFEYTIGQYEMALDIANEA